jgi:CYTH domain-containing protein
MSTTRRFLIASSLARLIRKDRGGGRVTEGYFPNQTGRSSHVHVEGDRGSLVLVTTPANGAITEERTDVPRTHAEALLDVAPGKVEYARSRLMAGGREIRIDRFVRPGPLDLISVEFENEEQATSFRPPAWFGPEVTSDAAYQNRALAIESVPQVPEVPLTNAALDSLLDTLENRLGIRPMQGRPVPASMPGVETGGDTLRRLSATFGAPVSPLSPRETDTSPVALAAGSGPTNPASPAAPAEGDQTASADAGEPATPTPSAPPAEESAPNLDIEDDVIRELARSLRPQRK